MEQKKLTIVIKTFNRKKSLLRLLKSIVKMNYNYPIIIVDDSKIKSREIVELFEDLDINYICTEFDIGLSKGRNILIDNVKTKYFFLCDDDFVFDYRTNLDENLNVMINNEDIDILGGVTYTRNSINSLFSLLTTLKHPQRIIHMLQKKETIETNNGLINIDNNNVVIKFERDYQKYIDKDLYDVDICINVFIAKTDSIKKMNGWQPENIKVGEHKTFFIRAKQYGLNVKFTKKLGVLHYPKKTMQYNKYRLRSYYMENEAFKYNNFSSVMVYDGTKLEKKYKRED